MVTTELKALVARASAAGRREEVIAALKRISHILEVYPQYGEPLRDLAIPGETLRYFCVPPLLVYYILDEPNRAVFLGRPFKAMSNSGFA
jgi:hypothetical protein